MSTSPWNGILSTSMKKQFVSNSLLSISFRKLVILITLINSRHFYYVLSYDNDFSFTFKDNK